MIIKTDGIIDLVKQENSDSNCVFIDIFLHGTNEVIGNIWFDKKQDSFFTKYFGNVGYEIYEKYRKKGYALRALNLIKDVMKEQKITSMYFSVSPNNTPSINTIKAFGANLMCYRKIPKANKLYDITMEKVIIYKYDIKDIKL